MVAAAAGIAAALAVGVINFAASTLQPERPAPKGLHAVMAIAAGLTGFGAAWGTGDWPSPQFAIPLMTCSSSLFRHSGVIYPPGLRSTPKTNLVSCPAVQPDGRGLFFKKPNTSEAQRKAQEQEQAKEAGFAAPGHSPPSTT